MSEFNVFRHQEAEYKLNKAVLDSDEPRDPVLAENQDFDTDLTERGKEDAEKDARAFFQSYNPETDAFFIASSDFVRTTETAKIYIGVAEELGFEIIVPDNPRDATVERVGDGKVRHVENLSLDIRDGLVDQLFSPETDYLKHALERGVEFDEDFIARWQEARKLIEADNKGTWSENWRHYGETLKQSIPEITTARETYEKQFKRLLQLMRFGEKKISESNHPKQIHTLAFTHENLFTHWLAESREEAGLELGEMVSFTVADANTGDIHATARGVETREN